MRKSGIFFAFVFAALLQMQICVVDISAQTGEITRQEMLRGSITPEREWWDVLHYHLAIEFFPNKKSIKGSNEIVFKTLKAGSVMQIDLQEPLKITKITHGASELKF